MSFPTPHEKASIQMDTAADRVWTSHSTTLSETIFWEIDDLQRRLEKFDTLLSDAFSFGGQRWRLLLLTDSTHLGASLSRVDSTGEPPLFPVVRWHAGVVDGDGKWHNDRSGYVPLDSPSQDWITVAEWNGPKWNDLSAKEEKFLPGGRMTLAVQLCWGSALDRTSVENNTTPCDVTVTVKDKTFLVQKPILEALSPVLAAMLFSNETDGADQGLHLDDCNPRTFEIVLSFLYTGSLDDLATKSLMEVYHVAEEYIVAGLREECARRLLKGLTEMSVCGVLALAEKHGDKELRERATEFFLEHATDIFNTSAWSLLEVTDSKLADELVALIGEKED